MPDLFDPLRDMDDLDVHPLPASAVRQRGDRLRRRRNTLRATAAAVVVAVVATGGAFAFDAVNGSADSRPPVSKEPPGGWRSEIPTSYPLDRDYPQASTVKNAAQEGPSQSVAPFAAGGLETCGAADSVYPSESRLDSAGTSFTRPELSLRRELTVYRDDATADRVVDRIVADARTCQNVTRARFGDQSFHLQLEGRAGNTVVRVGNAVLLDGITVDPEANDDPAAAVADEMAALAPVVADLCIFALDPCPSGAPTDPVVSSKIPPIDEDVLLTTDELARYFQLVGLGQIANREDPTLDCQADWLNTLEPRSGGFREWRGDGSEAATAVLEFADEQAARAAYGVVADWVESCRKRLPGTRSLSSGTSAGSGSSDGTLSTAMAFTASDPSGSTWYDHQHVGLIGSRVVLLSVGQLGTDEFDPLDYTTGQAMLAALDQARVPSGTKAGEEIGSDFPLVEGWPDDSQAESPDGGLDGPSRQLAPLRITLCDTTAPDPQHTDRLSATWRNPEDGRDRQLTTYADADRAVAAMRALVKVYQDCSEEPANDGFVRHYEAIRSSVGGESWALVTWYEYEGAPSIGRQIVHLIRVGRAILLDTTSNEGMGGPGQQDEVQSAIDAQADGTAAAVAAMCRFTVAGC